METDLSALTHLDLFSGIGGFSLGLERAGFNTIAFCEVDPFCRKVLKKHWPDVHCYEDIRELDGSEIRADIITGGFPCQPFSRANYKRRGSADKRELSGEMLRLVDEIKPAFVVGENTEGFIDFGLAPLCDAMEKIDYHAEVFSIPACAYGLPTMERHVWIIATPSSERSQRIREITIQIIEDGTKEFQGSDTRIPDRWYLPKARVHRVGERIPNRMDRSKSLGNAVDPIMPEIIGRAIMEAEKCAL